MAVSKAGFVFTPSSQPVTINGANGTVSFSSVAQTFTLSGTISGAGGSGATVSVTGAATASATANTSGVYTISGLPKGTYTVTPSKAGGYVFTPATPECHHHNSKRNRQFQFRPRLHSFWHH